MIDSILNFLGQGIAATFSWFDSLLDSTGSRFLLYGFITMALVFRFIILPIAGGQFGRSDSVKDSKSRNSDKDVNSSYVPDPDTKLLR